MSIAAIAGKRQLISYEQSVTRPVVALPSNAVCVRGNSESARQLL